MTLVRGWRGARLAVGYPLLSRLPRNWAYAAATLLGDLDGRLSRGLRTALGSGFLRVYPELRTDRATLARWTRWHARMCAREVLDAFVMPGLGARGLERMVRLEGVDTLAQAVAEGRGVILVMAHYSRLNMLLAALGARGVRMSMLTMRIDESNPELLPAERRYLSRKVRGLLQYIGGEWISLGDSLRPIYQGLARGDVWIILMDAHEPGVVPGSSLAASERRQYPFLGGTLSLARGIERIAARTGASLVYAGIREVSATALAGRLVRLPGMPEEALAAAVRELESDVRSAPWQWWHWNVLDFLWTPFGEAAA